MRGRVSIFCFDLLVGRFLAAVVGASVVYVTGTPRLNVRVLVCRVECTFVGSFFPPNHAGSSGGLRTGVR